MSRSTIEHQSITLYFHTQSQKQIQCPQCGSVVYANASALVLATEHFISFVQFSGHKLQNLEGFNLIGSLYFHGVSALSCSSFQEEKKLLNTVAQWQTYRQWYILACSFPCPTPFEGYNIHSEKSVGPSSIGAEANSHLESKKSFSKLVIYRHTITEM